MKKEDDPHEVINTCLFEVSKDKMYINLAFIKRTSCHPGEGADHQTGLRAVMQCKNKTELLYEKWLSFKHVNSVM